MEDTLQRVTEELIPKTRNYCRNYEKKIKWSGHSWRREGIVIKDDPIRKIPLGRLRLR